jgi:mannose-1-phosphate guanylyltransferase
VQWGVIMAGGRGTRLWPLSRESRPKQLIPLIDGRSLLELAYERLAAVLDPAHILVCTNARDAAAVRELVPDLPADNLLGEPVGRDTVNAVGLSCAVLARRDPEAVVAFVTADHVISPLPVFADALRAAYELAELPGRLVTFGVVPTHPHVGLGYVRRGAPIAGTAGFRVSAFVEKPDAERAAAYVAAGDYLWNSGMFVWRASTLLDQLAARLPDNARRLATIADAWDAPERDAVLAAEYEQLAATSIDYGVLEPASTDPAVEVAVVPLDLEWLDVGSWPALAAVLPTDDAGNAVGPRDAAVLLVDSRDNIIFTTDPERLIATLGLHDTVIVHTADVTLVCPRSAADRLKDLVAAVRGRSPRARSELVDEGQPSAARLNP